MDESKSQQQELKRTNKFSQEQYDMLIRCSEKKDIAEWNKWRDEHKGERVLLEGANFEEAQLKDADLSGAHLEEAILYKAHLEGADLRLALLEEATLWEAHLEGAKLNYAHLERAKLDNGHLEKASFGEAHLEGATFHKANLEGANFQTAIVDGETLLWDCVVDHDTDFHGVGLSGARIETETKQLLEYNIRRRKWEDWYKTHPKVGCLVKGFWWVSDYGLSTGRIIFTFFALAFIFANIYYHWGRLAPVGVVSNLFTDGQGAAVQWWLVPLRTLYFSIVTMTTLGFSGMHANAQSFFGHLLLTVQMLLGYALLGALVARFAVMFRAGGPAGKFAEEKKTQSKK
ncbi:MAG: pentapeptide repeat-containing protein [Planctomycetota bacterium]|jgi:uncharacterized protein YjbI with pentapeptide repeats